MVLITSANLSNGAKNILKMCVDYNDMDSPSFAEVDVRIAHSLARHEFQKKKILSTTKEYLTERGFIDFDIRLFCDEYINKEFNRGRCYCNTRLLLIALMNVEGHLSSNNHTYI